MHRHGYQGRKFGRAAGPRRAMLRGLATALVLYESITTTEARAKELKGVIDRLITQAKKGTLADRRRVAAYLYEEVAVRKLFEETAPYYKDRTSGFTRLTRVGVRVGDASPMVQIALIDYKPVVKKPVARSEKPGAGSEEPAVSEPQEPEAVEPEKPKPKRTRAPKPTEKEEVKL